MRLAAIKTLLVISSLCVFTRTFAGEILTNESVIELAKAGFPEEVLLAKLNGTSGNYKTSVSELIRLKKEGVPDRVVARMVELTDTVTAAPGKPANPPKTAEKAELKEIFSVESTGITMRLIRPGSFVMGNEDGNPWEQNLTNVTITKPYWIGTTEVTQGQWRKLIGTGVEEQRDRVNKRYSLPAVGDDCPMVYISWDDGAAFCRILTEQERSAGRLPNGYVYALPTEAQWEYACRAGSTGLYAGDEDSMSWHFRNSKKIPHPVATKLPNAWGLYDMHGNVREWCSDWAADKWRLPGGNVIDPKGPTSGTEKVHRGGDFMGVVTYSALRSGGKTNKAALNYGFRVALVPE